MTIFSYLSLFGGIGLFLFGMSLLGSSLEQVAGASLERTLEKLTNNRLKGFSLGILVTGVIQSSAATTIMVIGFVNAGIMKLIYGIPVVFGANIGSTVTAQILRLGDMSEDNIVLSLLKPSSFAPVCIGIAAFILLISRKKKTRSIASIIMGFGILFCGMTTMENALAPLRESEAFQQMFLKFSNPLVVMLVGMVITMILQSSSASVGILQALTTTGTVTFATAVPLIVGQNVGKCITVILGSIGTYKKAKRLAASHLIFNILGAIICLSSIYLIQHFIGIPCWKTLMNRGNIADIHLAFNVITSLILLPFTKNIEKLTGKIIKDDEESKIEKELSLLDDIFLKTPSIAINQSRKVLLSMFETITDNFTLAKKLQKDFNAEDMEKLQEGEAFLDKSETMLTEYLVKIDAEDLSDTDNQLATEILSSISDVERIGDYCVKLANVGRFDQEENISFSEAGVNELEYLSLAVENVLTLTTESFRNDDMEQASKVEPLITIVDTLKETLKEHHIMRLQAGDCSTAAGISLVELVTSYERMAKHCSNIALHIIKKVSNDDNFDIHAYAKNLRLAESASAKELQESYLETYLNPVTDWEKEYKKTLAAAKKNSKKTEKKEKSSDKDGKKDKDKKNGKNKKK